MTRRNNDIWTEYLQTEVAYIDLFMLEDRTREESIALMNARPQFMAYIKEVDKYISSQRWHEANK